MTLFKKPLNRKLQPPTSKYLLALTLAMLGANANAADVDAAATVHKHCNYRGTTVALNEGRYTLSQLTELGVTDNDISSLTLQSGYKATLYQDDDFSGNSLLKKTNDGCLINDNFNDVVSSIVVEADVDSVATVHKHCNYGGTSVALNEGRYTLSQLAALGVTDNDISSLTIQSGYKVTLYQGDNFSGNSLVKEADDGCLINDSFNDVISSIVVEAEISTPNGGATGPGQYSTYLFATNTAAPGLTQDGGVPAGNSLSWGGNYNLAPKSHTKIKGVLGTQGLGALTGLENPNADTEEGYVQFLDLTRCEVLNNDTGECTTFEDPSNHDGIFVFDMPQGQSASALNSLTVKSNFFGADGDNWVFNVKNQESGLWEALGTVTSDYAWVPNNWILAGDLANYVSNNSQLEVQVTTANASANFGGLDYLAIEAGFPTIANGSTAASSIEATKDWDQESTSTNTGDFSVRLKSTSSPYSGDYTFAVPSAIALTDITELGIETNFKSQEQASQDWSFELYNYTTSSYVEIGDNEIASNDDWTPYYVQPATGTDANYVDASGNIKLRIKSDVAFGDAELDFLAVRLTADVSAKPVGITSWHVPAPLATWYWQLSAGDEGTVSPATQTAPVDQSWYNATDQLYSVDRTYDTVDVVDFDLLAVPQEDFDHFHSKGAFVMCYFSTQFEANRKLDQDAFISAADAGTIKPGAEDALGACIQKDSTLGEVEGNCWAPAAGSQNWERWLNPKADAVRDLFKQRLDIAVARGCDGVEPDNIDSYSQPYDTGVTATPLVNQGSFTQPTQEISKDLNLFLAHEAHKRGLFIAFKNSTADISITNTAVDQSRFYDLAVNEECNEYSECETNAAFTDQNKAILNAEYGTDGPALCAAFVALQTVVPPVKITGTVRGLSLSDTTVYNCF